MTCRWEIIGAQLHQSVLVRNLRCVPGYDVVRKCQQVIEAAMESGNLPNYGVLLKVLRSDGVDLAEVASKLVVAVELSQRRSSQQNATAQPTMTANGDSQQPQPSTSTDATERTHLLNSYP